MKTLRDFYDAVAAIMPADLPFSITVEVWQHRRGDTDDFDIAYRIWDGEHHHEGSTPEVALDSLRSFRCPVVPAGALDVTLMGEGDAH